MSTIEIVTVDSEDGTILLKETETGIGFKFYYETYGCSMCQGDTHCRYDLLDCTDSKLGEHIRSLDEVILLDGSHEYGDHNSLCEDLEKVLRLKRGK